MNTVELNKEAVETAVLAIMGRFEAAVSAAAEDAWRRGYELGRSTAEDKEYASGYQDGLDQAEEEFWEEGYLDGVGDARSEPELADITVKNILSERAEEEHVATAAAALDDEFAMDAGVPVA
jgi:flagellar biosynthesis/type III secretory pathway protein FliH